MMQSKFKQVDVFTSVPMMGNPVAVVLSGQSLDSQTMQKLATWTNLSETTFVLPSTVDGADYKVRIFTPTMELPFAGHPTIGTAHAIIESGLHAPKNGVLVQECGVGLVAVYVEGNGPENRTIQFEAPSAAITDLDPTQLLELAHLLGTSEENFSPKFVNLGPNHTVLEMGSARKVLALKPDLKKLQEFSEKYATTGLLVFGKHEEGSPAAIETRAFFPILGIDEDPVCGSGNAAIASLIKDSGRIGDFGREYLARQGAAVGRDGYVLIKFQGDRILVGGKSVTCLDGTLSL